MDDKLTAKTAKSTSLENLYVYGKCKQILDCNMSLSSGISIAANFITGMLKTIAIVSYDDCDCDTGKR